MPSQTMQTDANNTSQAMLLAAIDDAFLKSNYLALRTIEVEINEDFLVLKGRVPSFYLKQMAQTHAGRAVQEYRVVNEIEVVPDELGRGAFRSR